MKRSADKIIIALDVEELDAARELLELLKEDVGAFKIGKQLFTRCGPEAVRMVHAAGSRVFLDLKYHDIPTTVAKAGIEVARMGVLMFNVHALGGRTMMRETVAAVQQAAAQAGAPRPLVLAVTVLTSMGPEDLAELGISEPVEDLVVRLARLARAAGADGVVASPREIRPIKQACGPEFRVVTPGIRPASAQLNDQKRTMTPAEAVRAGADYIVVGRPVTQAPDPRAAARGIVAELDS